jgi:hypothetical protein
MSFKVKFRDDLFKLVSQRSQKVLQDALKAKKLGEDIAAVVIKDIQIQTRSGKSIPNGGRLKSLSKSWIKTRGKIIKANGVASYVKQSRSNLSLSSQLLDSLKSRQKPTNRGLEVGFFFSGDHQPYKLPYAKTWQVKRAFGRSGTLTFKSSKTGIRTIGRKIKNSKLATYVERDRPFIGVRPQVQATLRQLVLREVRRILRNR